LDAHDQILEAKSTVHHSNQEQIKEHFDNIYHYQSQLL